jgi:trigger factor
MEQFRSGYTEPAKSRVKQQLVVEEIIKVENFTATQEEIDKKVAEQAKSVSKEVEEYKKGMDPRQFEYIANSIVVEKLFNFLKENNNIA